MTRVRVTCGQSDGSSSPTETAGRLGERGMGARPPKTPHLAVALAIALVCLACAGVARAQVGTEPVSEAPAAPVTPTEAPAEVTDPVSEPPAAPTASGSGDSIVVTNSASTTPGIDAVFSVPSSDSSAAAVIGGEPSAPRSDSGRGKRASPSVLDPQRVPTGPQAPAPASAGVSGSSGGGFSGGLFAALVGCLILVAPGLGRVLSLSLTPVRAPTLVGGLERPD
jgi:hypothetical protein